MKTILEYWRLRGINQWLIQSAFIVFAVLLSIFTVTWVLEKSLIREALEMEADAFIESWEKDHQFPLPRTRNLTGYLADKESISDIPEQLVKLLPGLYKSVSIDQYQASVPVYVRDFSDKRLYLVFNGANVDRLVGIFGLLPLASLLIIIYGGSWIAYRLTSRAVSPILRIAKNLRETAPDNLSLNIPEGALRGEARELADALEEYRRKNELLVEKERQFTADVSHELRTPMTIIDGASQFLNNEKNLSAKGVERVQMIRRASRDVNELINAFLLLARSQSVSMNGAPVQVSEVINSEVDKLRPFVDKSRVSIETEVAESFEVSTPRKALEIIIGNILRNAAKYTEQGSIKVSVSANHVLIEDTGMGIPSELIPQLFERHVRGRGLQQAGEGIGLAIVKRLCDQFDWAISIQNKQDVGVRVDLNKIEKL